MWTMQASDGHNARLSHEDDARRYVARLFPNADRVGVYTWQCQGVNISIKHS